ncbi:MAG: LCP family protein [Acidimicrobiia bacterium]|nr:LCP family protein [Acidimicrobiia bacterium]
MNDLDLLRSWVPSELVEVDPMAAADARDALHDAIQGPTAEVAAEPRGRRRFAARALIAATVTTALAVGGFVVATRVVDDRIDHVKRVDVNVGGDGRLTLPTTVLVVGSDSRDFVQDPAQAQAFGTPADTPGKRSDTMMLVRLDADRTTAVALPRDLLVSGGAGPPRQLNSYFDAGPQSLLDAVQRHLGVTIDHYVELDFAQFVTVVDAVGGVRMTVPVPIRDSYSGLDIATPGCRNFDGNDALAFVRSRHLESWSDGRWVDASPRADLDRISRQQRFLDALVTQARDRVGDDIGSAVDLADKVARAMTVDSAMSRDQIKQLAGRFIGQGPRTWSFATLPVTASATEPGRLDSTGPTGPSIFDHPNTTATTTTTPAAQSALAALGNSC